MFFSNKKEKLYLARIKELSSEVNTLTGLVETKTTGGKKYKSHISQVQQIIKMYLGEADYGCEFVQRLVNVIAAFTLPHGVGIKYKDDAHTQTVDYIEHFMDYNNLESSTAIQLAQEAQIQGQILVRLQAREIDGEIRVVMKYMPYDQYGYTVKTDDDGNMTVEYESEDGKVILDGKDIVFISFNGLMGRNEGRPRIGGIIEVLEYLSMDLEAWRHLNKLGAFNTPYFQCEDSGTVATIFEWIRKKGWKLGNAFAGKAKLELIGPNTKAADMLKDAITTNIKIVSGVVGVAIHYLGFADVMNNRSTADSMGEAAEVVSNSEIALWLSFYETLFDKAIRSRNEYAKKNGKPIQLIPGQVKPKIQPMTDRQWELVKDVWLKLFENGAIDIQTLLDKVPDIEANEVMERLDVDDELKQKSGFNGGKEPNDNED